MLPRHRAFHPRIMPLDQDQAFPANFTPGQICAPSLATGNTSLIWPWPVSTQLQRRGLRPHSSLTPNQWATSSWALVWPALQRLCLPGGVWLLPRDSHHGSGVEETSSTTAGKLSTVSAFQSHFQFRLSGSVSGFCWDEALPQGSQL